jgi:hypothetical protein
MGGKASTTSSDRSTTEPLRYIRVTITILPCGTTNAIVIKREAGRSRETKRTLRTGQVYS